MVSGGSGITPFISIIRDLMHMSETMKCQTPKILLVSAFKNSSDLTMLDVLLPISGAPAKVSELGLQIEAYITREKQESPTDNDMKNVIRTIWFKPKSSDAPISPVLGQNNWFWLGTIISLSFIIYLFSMAVLTRYYIYPIDHNTNEIYPNASRAILNMLLICIAVMITCTAVFLWNKMGNAAENKQIQNMEGVTPTASPNSWFYNPERELESFPNQTLVQCTNVHYGQRPDLKKILLEIKESSVGVLVSGPKKMRHEVAEICSSGLADNLHFESISFSW
ncbi:oxidase [Lithospermum erythrorhizon]|uniref:Oxidase n=1 Tax=Lithospermum erythrorhizon TaxID=34254 RepID=A0AAV3NJ49_LITER